MTMVQRLELRQAQSLVMTPQLQQAIKLLQFSHGELMEFIEGELEQNPLLEADEPSDEPGFKEEADESALDQSLKSEDPLDTDFENVSNAASIPPTSWT